MFRVWTANDDDPEDLARRLEAHLNEFAAEVIDVSYSVRNSHFVMAIYRPVEPAVDARSEAAVSVAEEIVGDAQT
jgi:hypothetical protein